MTGHTLLHETPIGCCRFVLFYVKRRITRFGPLHQLAVACGQRIERVNQPWCETHRPGLTEPARTKLSIPADRNIITRRPTFSCEEV